MQVEPIRNMFAALFLASIGMLIDVQFLWNHVDILLAAVILVIVVKTVVVATVVKGFGYNNKTSLLVRFQKLLQELIFIYFMHFIDGGGPCVIASVGWNVFGTNWRICFCFTKSCF